MRALLSVAVGLIIACGLLGEASAQIRLGAWVMAGGGGTCVCTSYRTDCTLGEPITGGATGTNGMQGAGFWGAVGGSPATSVMQHSREPLCYGLEHNYPNPFNPSTVISCTIPVAGHLRISVFNMLGEEVAILVNDIKEAGTTTVMWNAAGLPSGVYFYRMSAGVFTDTQKMVLLRLDSRRSKEPSRPVSAFYECPPMAGIRTFGCPSSMHHGGSRWVCHSHKKKTASILAVRRGLLTTPSLETGRGSPAP